VQWLRNGPPLTISYRLKEINFEDLGTEFTKKKTRKKLLHDQDTLLE